MIKINYELNGSIIQTEFSTNVPRVNDTVILKNDIVYEVHDIRSEYSYKTNESIYVVVLKETGKTLL